MLEYKVQNNKYKNVKEILTSYFEISNRLLVKLKKNQRIFLNDNAVYVTHEVSENDILKIDIDFDEESDNIVPTKMNLEIIYEDDYMLIINKPSNLAIHPSILHYEDSLSNGVAYYFKEKGIKRKIRPVNRLDKDTSGIVIFAKNEYIQECLVKQMKNNTFKKKYLAILEGHLENKFGTINAPIDRKENSIIERTISEGGFPSITHYKVLKKFEINNSAQKLSLVEFALETGRTHQIRVHSKYIKHPLLGDSLYGNASTIISRQALHAYKISFIHPITKGVLNFEIPLPEDINNIVKQ